MKRIKFLDTNWPADHPVYRLMHDYVPEGWGFCGTEPEADLIIAPTQPVYEGAKPWLVFIEDWVTLYNNEIQNGHTSGIDVLNHPKTAALREKFRRPNFKGIVCHHRGAFADLNYLGLTDKLFYAPVGLPGRPIKEIGRNKEIRFLFTNSWKAGICNFRNRGGELVLAAFRALWESGRRDMRLFISCGIESDDGTKNWLAKCPGVEVNTAHVTNDDLNKFMANSDCVVLPAHRVHVHSILLPFSFGLPVIGSDGWGFDEYLIDGANGLTVRGINGVTSWRDTLFREDYTKWVGTMRAVEMLMSQMVKLSDNRDLLRRMGESAHDYVNDVHPVARTRRMLGEIYRNAL